jgi:1-acyl-sn-glycerol-3-phosphate acyltransferase
MLRRILVQYVYGTFCWTTFFVVSVLNIVLGFGLQMLLRPFDQKRSIASWTNRWLWGHALFWAELGFPLRRFGFEKVGPGPYIIVSNHTSMLDIPACLSLPVPVRVTAKASIFRVPLMGWYMRFSKMISVDRGGGADAIASTMKQCHDALEQGISILFFPEGSRSANTRLLSFKRGAFRIAKDTGTPVLPIAIYGGHHSVNKGNPFQFRLFAPIHMRVLDPIDPADWPTARAVSNRAREAISVALDDLREEVEPLGRFPAFLSDPTAPRLSEGPP